MSSWNSKLTLYLFGSFAFLPVASELQGDAFPAPPQAEPAVSEPAARAQAPASGQASSPASSQASSPASVPGELSKAEELPLRPSAPRHSGSWDEGYDALRARIEAGEWDEGLVLAESLLQPSFLQNVRVATLAEGKEWQRSAMTTAEPLFRWLGLMQPEDRERAELRFARGYLQAAQARELLREGDQESGEAGLLATEKARADFSAARALAGAGELRREATYSQSRVVAERAEEARLGIPEIREKLGLPALPPPAPAAPPATPGDEEEEDPDADLKAVRELYLTAREPLLERLRLKAFADADVQANLELIQRRLRELASIERQREEQEQEQQDQQQDSKDESEEGDQEQEDQESSDESESDENSEPQDGEGEEQDPSEQESPPEGEDESDEKGEGEEEAEPQIPEDGFEPTDQVPEDAERYLTREEAMRLLEQLEKIEEEGESVRRQVRQGQRVPVDRDW